MWMGFWSGGDDGWNKIGIKLIIVIVKGSNREGMKSKKGDGNAKQQRWSIGFMGFGKGGS